MASRGAPASSFPRIVRFIGTNDAPGSTCPHCGAEGRYIIRFVVEDGRTLGAMRGCVNLFPVSRVAQEELRLRQKLERRQKNYGRAAMLNRRDAEALGAIEDFFAGMRDERSTLSIIDGAKFANQRYRRR
jgi:hypothetical protein